MNTQIIKQSVMGAILAVASLVYSSVFAVEIPTELKNGSFENPRNTNYYSVYTGRLPGGVDTNNICWAGLSLDPRIEIGSVAHDSDFASLSRSVYNATTAKDNDQFCELCQGGVGGIFQAIATEPGENYKFSASFKSRRGTEMTDVWLLSTNGFMKVCEHIYLPYLRGEISMTEATNRVATSAAAHGWVRKTFVTELGDYDDWVSSGDVDYTPNSDRTVVAIVAWDENPKKSAGHLVDDVRFFKEGNPPEPTTRLTIANPYHARTATITYGSEVSTLRRISHLDEYIHTNTAVNISLKIDNGSFLAGALTNGVFTSDLDSVTNFTVFSGRYFVAPITKRARTVSLVLCGGTYGEDCPSEEIVLEKYNGSSHVLAAPTRPGFVFRGWYTPNNIHHVPVGKPIVYVANEDKIVYSDDDGSLYSRPGAEGMILVAKWDMDMRYLTDYTVEFVDRGVTKLSRTMKVGETLSASENPVLPPRGGFGQFFHTGWTNTSYAVGLSTNVSVTTLKHDGATVADGMSFFGDVEGGIFATTNDPLVRFDAVWTPGPIREWAVVHEDNLGKVSTKYFMNLSEALAALKDDDLLKARPTYPGHGIGDGLTPDTNDAIVVDCPFVITNNGVTVDLSGRVLNTSLEDAGFLLVAKGSALVVIENGYLFSASHTVEGQEIGPQDCRGVGAFDDTMLEIRNSILYLQATNAAVIAHGGSMILFKDCRVDGEGDGAAEVYCAIDESWLYFKNVKGYWNDNNFWNSPVVPHSLDNLTGEQFLLEDSYLTLDATVVSNGFNSASSPLPFIVVSRGDSQVNLLNWGVIREGAKGSTAGAISVESGCCHLYSGEITEDLHMPEGWVVGKLVTNVDAELVCGPGCYSHDPTDTVDHEDMRVIKVESDGVHPAYWKIVKVSDNASRDRIAYLIHEIGVTNINVNAVTPFESNNALIAADDGNLSLWLANDRKGFAYQMYRAHHQLSAEDVTANHIPDGYFPTTTVESAVWRFDGESLTNAYNVLSSEVGQILFDQGVVEALKSFGPLVKSVSRGAGTATFPYVSENGDNRLGKMYVFGCEPGDLALYDYFVDKCKMLGQGFEWIDDSETRIYSVTNSNSQYLGFLTPSVVATTNGFVLLYSTVAAAEAAYANRADSLTGPGSCYYNMHKLIEAGAEAAIHGGDTALATRNMKVDGFERFGYKVRSPNYREAYSKCAHDFADGLFSTLIDKIETLLSDHTFCYAATYCSEVCSEDNNRMRIDVQGSTDALKLFGAALRVTDRFMVNAGFVDEKYMTFDESWQFDSEITEKISVLAGLARERLGLSGVNYYRTIEGDRVKTVAAVGYERGSQFVRMFASGKASDYLGNPAEDYLPANTVAAFSFQPEAAEWAMLNARLFEVMGIDNKILNMLTQGIISHPDNFGHSAAIGVVNGYSVESYGRLLGGLDLISVFKIESDNLWASIRMLLQKSAGATVVQGSAHPDVIDCFLPNGTVVCYDPLRKMVIVATSAEASIAAVSAGRGESERLFLTAKMSEHFGVTNVDGDYIPDHNTLYYIAPEGDAILIQSLDEYFQSIGLGGLSALYHREDFSDFWMCGYGVKSRKDGLLYNYGYFSTSILERAGWVFDATAETFGQIMAEAFPYDASAGQVFTCGSFTVHVSRADNNGTYNGKTGIYDNGSYSYNNVRVRIVSNNDNDEEGYDEVLPAHLYANGLLVTYDNSDRFIHAYLTSEGMFGQNESEATNIYFIARPAPEITPELAVLPSAEEVAGELRAVLDDFGVTNITIGAVQDDGVGPDGESVASRVATFVRYAEGSGLDQIMSDPKHADCLDASIYMPADTLFGMSVKCSASVVSNIMAAISYVQPSMSEFIGDFFDSTIPPEVLGAFRGGFAAGLLPDVAESLLPLPSGSIFSSRGYLVIAMKDNDYTLWNQFTNMMYNSSRVVVLSNSSDEYSSTIKYLKYLNISSQRVGVVSAVVPEGPNAVPVIIFSSDEEVNQKVIEAGALGTNRLIDDATFKACRGSLSLDKLNAFNYLAPRSDSVWYFQALQRGGENNTATVITRTSPQLAVAVSSVLRFADNFVALLTGNDTVFEFMPDQTVEAAAAKKSYETLCKLYELRNKIGLTGVTYTDYGLDTDGKWGSAQIDFGVTGLDALAMRTVAFDEPSDDIAIERYLDDNMVAVGTFDRDPVVATNIIESAIDSFAGFLDDKYPYLGALLRQITATDSYRMTLLGTMLTGNYKAIAISQDKLNPFVYVDKDGVYRSSADRYALTLVSGQVENDILFEGVCRKLMKEDAVFDWISFKEGGAQYVTCTNLLDGGLSLTIAYSPIDKVMVFSTDLLAAKRTMAAGLAGENRLLDSARFKAVMGLEDDASLPAHNNFTYVAPDNDERFAYTLRRLLSNRMPEMYSFLFDASNLDRHWGGFYGYRDGEHTYRMVVHSASRSHTGFTAAAQAVLLSLAEEAQRVMPFDWTEAKTFLGPDGFWNVDASHHDDGKALVTEVSRYGVFADIASTKSVSVYSDDSGTWSFALSRYSIFSSSAWYDEEGITLFCACSIGFLDENNVIDSDIAAIAVEMEGGYIQELPAGEEVDLEVFVKPAHAQITKVTGLPKGLKLKKSYDSATGCYNYRVTGTPKEVGEETTAIMQPELEGFFPVAHDFRFTILNYRSAAMSAELEQCYDCFIAGVENVLTLPQTIGWKVSGLPSGLVFDSATGVISGTAKKPGSWLVTFTKKVDGKSEKATTILTVGQDGIDIRVNLLGDLAKPKRDGEQQVNKGDGIATETYVGVKVDWPIALNGLVGVENKLKVKGLPSGLKLVRYDDGSYAISGVPARASKTDKKTGELVPFEIVFSASNRWGWTGETKVLLTVKSLPTWAVGTFNGMILNIKDNVPTGDISITVAKNGKLSFKSSGVNANKIVRNTYKCDYFDEYDELNQGFLFHTTVISSDGREATFSGSVCLDKSMMEYDLELDVLPSLVSAYLTVGTDLYWVNATHDMWDEWEFPSGKETLKLVFTAENNPDLVGSEITITKGGQVKISGTIPGDNGATVKISDKTTLIVYPPLTAPGKFTAVLFGTEVKAQDGLANPVYVGSGIYLMVDGNKVIAVSETMPLQ